MSDKVDSPKKKNDNKEVKSEEKKVTKKKVTKNENVKKDHIKTTEKTTKKTSKNPLDKFKNPVIPTYLKDTYNWAYIKPSNVKMLDNPLVYHTILFGQGWRLMNMYLDEINEGQKVLQVAHVYGNILKKVAAKIGDDGQLDIIDILPIQVSRAKQKLGEVPWVKIWQQDAIMPYANKYDIVGLYFLLHEVPDHVKEKTLKNALYCLTKKDDKVVIIDYHDPKSLHPVRPILHLVNVFLEPYARTMWEKNIEDMIEDSSKYNIKKTTIFGGVYQKVVITKKDEYL